MNKQNKNIEEPLNTLLVKVMQRAYYNARETGLPLKEATNGEYSIHFWDGWLTAVRNDPEYAQYFEKIDNYTPNDQVRKMQEEAEYKVLMDFKEFVANGTTTDRFWDDFEAEFELFMVRNYAELRVKSLSEQEKHGK